MTRRTSIGLRNRASRRGAAIVESLIVSSLLITLMASGMFFFRLYSAQQKALMDARTAAWSKAMKGCSPTIDLGELWNELKSGDVAAVAEDIVPTVPPFFGVVGHTSGSGSSSASGSSRTGGGNYSFNASNTVPCNEIANDKRGDIGGLIGYVGSTILPRLTF